MERTSERDWNREGKGAKTKKIGSSKSTASDPCGWMDGWNDGELTNDGARAIQLVRMRCVHVAHCFRDKDVHQNVWWKFQFVRDDFRNFVSFFLQSHATQATTMLINLRHSCDVCNNILLLSLIRDNNSSIKQFVNLQKPPVHYGAAIWCALIFQRKQQPSSGQITREPARARNTQPPRGARVLRSSQVILPAH